MAAAAEPQRADRTMPRRSICSSIHHSHGRLVTNTPKREGGRERGRQDGMGGRERKQRHFSAVYLESQYYIDYGRGEREGVDEGDRPVEFSPIPLLFIVSSAMPSPLTEQTLPKSRAAPADSSLAPVSLSVLIEVLPFANRLRTEACARVSDADG